MFNFIPKIFKKQKPDDQVVEDTTNQFSHGPQLTREKKLYRSILFYRGFILLLGFCYFITVVLFALKDPVTIVVDSMTGEVIGEYRTTAYKTREEIKGGMQKFLQYYLSFNSKTVFLDHSRAINMLNDELSKERFEYLDKTNLTYDIAAANSTSYLDFNPTKIKEIKDGQAVAELTGNLVIETHGAQPTTQPFHFVIKAKMVTLKGNDTIGLEITEIFEHD